jgi:ribonuclease P protein component
LPSKQGLSRSERITRKFEYSSVISRHNATAGKYLKAYLLIEQGAKRKAGFIAGKTVGPAVVRNRARRLLKEAYRRLKPELRDQGFKIVFVATPGIRKAGVDDVQAEMRRILKKTGLVD